MVELPGTTDFPKQAIPVLLATLKAEIPAEKWCAPQLQGQVGDAGSLKSALGREGAESLAAIVVGTRPPALQLEECLIPENVVGLYPQGDENSGNFLMRIKPGLAGLTLLD